MPPTYLAGGLLGAGQFRGLGWYWSRRSSRPVTRPPCSARGSKDLAHAMRGGTGAAMALIAFLLLAG
jgi:hypothetical protein